MNNRAVSGLLKVPQLANISTDLSIFQWWTTARWNDGAHDQCLPVFIILRKVRHFATGFAIPHPRALYFVSPASFFPGAPLANVAQASPIGNMPRDLFPGTRQANITWTSSEGCWCAQTQKADQSNWSENSAWYWRDELKRVVLVIKMLAKRAWPFVAVMRLSNNSSNNSSKAHQTTETFWEHRKPFRNLTHSWHDI